MIGWKKVRRVQIRKELKAPLKARMWKGVANHIRVPWKVSQDLKEQEQNRSQTTPAKRRNTHFKVSQKSKPTYSKAMLYNDQVLWLDIIRFLICRFQDIISFHWHYLAKLTLPPAAAKRGGFGPASFLSLSAALALLPRVVIHVYCTGRRNHEGHQWREPAYNNWPPEIAGTLHTEEETETQKERKVWDT